MNDRRRTTQDDGRQPIAIGHLSASGDLKSSNVPNLEVMTKVNFKKKIGQMSMSKGLKPTEGIFIRNMESLISKIFYGKKELLRSYYIVAK